MLSLSSRNRLGSNSTLKTKHSTLHNFRAGEPVVQEQTLAVHQRPQKPGAREQAASKREQEAVESVAQGERGAFARDDPDAPGLHRQRLAAAAPLPD